MESKINEDLLLWNKISKEDDVAAFDTLFNKYSDVLYNYGMYLISDREEVKDKIQDVFINFYKNRKTIFIEDSLKQYLLISFRRLLFKKSSIQKATVLLEGDDFFDKETPESELLAKELVQINEEKFLVAFKQLSDREKEVILLRYFEDETSQSVSKIMDLEINSVYKLLSKSVSKLKKFQNNA